MTVTPMNRPNPDAIHRCAKHPEKVQYRAIDAAFDAAERSAARQGQTIYVYACDHCGYYHLSKKNGTETIGHRIRNREDGRLWSTESPFGAEPVQRDVRFIPTGIRAVNRQRVIDALRAHGNPETVSALEVSLWSGVSRDVVSKILRDDLGWAPSGATKSRRWHRQGPPLPEPEPTETTDPAETPPPPADTGWQSVSPKLLQDMTVGQLVRVYGTMNVEVEVRIRPRESK